MESMRKTVGNAAILSFIVAVAMTLVSMLGMRWLLTFMNTPEDIFDDAYTYIMIICGGIFTQVLYNLLSSILRALGNSKTPLYFLLLSAGLNIVLDLDNAFHRMAFTLCGMEEHFDHMLSTFQHIERLRKFSLQTDENKSVCAAHTRILEAVLHGSEEDVSRALSDHLNRYRLSVEQARQRHPDYFTEE